MRSTSDLCILRTPHLIEADMVCATFDEEGIPCYRRSESISGLERAMPAAAAPAWGQTFTVWIPAAERERALAILDSLNIASEPEADAPDPASERMRRFVLWGWGITLVLLIVAYSVDGIIDFLTFWLDAALHFGE